MTAQSTKSCSREDAHGPLDCSLRLQILKPPSLPHVLGALRDYFSIPG